MTTVVIISDNEDTQYHRCLYKQPPRTKQKQAEKKNINF